jgi:hypothetical protein
MVRIIKIKNNLLGPFVLDNIFGYIINFNICVSVSITKKISIQ